MSQVNHIERLCDHQSVQPALEKLFIETWAPWYGADGQGNAAADLAKMMRDGDELPIGLVALGSEGELVGFAGLGPCSVGEDIAPGPWLTSLVVVPEYRGRGIGARLIGAVEALARELGYGDLYCSTDSVAGTLQTRGWKRVGDAQSQRGQVDVFGFALSN